MIESTGADGGAKSFRELVEEARTERGFTQKELAAHLGMSVRQYSSIVNGHTKNPQPRNRRALLEWLREETAREVSAEMVEQTPELPMCPECGAVQWPGDIRVFLDTIGAFLLPMTEAERMRFIHEETRRIISSRH